MGSYASFSIDGYQLLSSKSVVNAVVMMVFTEAEKRIRYEKHAESNPAEPSPGDELENEKDVLLQTDGTFVPVHWRGFDSAVRAYQGELESKAALQEKFSRKLSAARSNSKLVQTQDWAGIRAILDMVRQAFENETE